jgi:hypothetical protein
LLAYESKKEHRRSEAAAVGAAIKLSLDFTVQSGLNVGEKFLLTIKNENGQTVGKEAGATSNYKDYEVMIREIGQRANVTAPLLCLDDVVEIENGDYDRATSLLMRWLPSTQECVLDRFHVVHRVNEVFNPHHSRHYELMIVKQRGIVTSRDGHLQRTIDARLRAGTLKKEVTFRGVKHVWGDAVKMSEMTLCGNKRIEAQMTQFEIDAHQNSGLYHAILSSTCALVPLILNPRKHVEDFYPSWQAEVSEVIRQCSMATALRLTTVATMSNQAGMIELVPAGQWVHSWPGAAPLVHTHDIPMLSMPRRDGLVVLDFIGSKGEPLLTIKLLDYDEGTEPLTLSVSCEISSMGGEGCTGKLSVNVSCGIVSSSQIELVPLLLKAAEVTDAKGQVLCDWVEFERRTRLGKKRFALCSIEKLTSIKPFRETTKDQNGEMQHESLIAALYTPLYSDVVGVSQYFDRYRGCGSKRGLLGMGHISRDLDRNIGR